MSIVYRQELGRELTWSEADNNFAELKAGVDSKKSNFDVLPVTQGGTGQETVDAVKVAFDIATKTDLASSAAGKGAEMVGLDDGATGALWTTVKGFVARLLASTGAGTGAYLVGWLLDVAGSVGRTIFAKLREIPSIQDFGAPTDGVASARSAINMACTNLAAAYGDHSLLMVRGVYLIDSDLTIPATTQLIFQRGARFKIANGVTLTLSGVDIRAGRHQIFECVGTGKVVGHVANDLIFPEWWGAIADGLHSNGADFTARAAAAARNGPAINAALVFAGYRYTIDGCTGSVSLTYGYYLSDRTTVIPLSVNLIGYGIGSGIFYYAATGNAVEMKNTNNSLASDFFIAPIGGPTWNYSSGYGLVVDNVSTPCVRNVWSSGFGGGCFYINSSIEGRLDGLIADNSNGPSFVIRGVGRGTVLNTCVTAGNKSGPCFDIQSGYDWTLIGCTAKDGTGGTHGFYLNACENVNLVSCFAYDINRDGFHLTSSSLNCNLTNCVANNPSTESTAYYGFNVSGTKNKLAAPKVTANAPNYTYGIQLGGGATDCTVENPTVTKGSVGTIKDAQPIGSNNYHVHKVSTSDATATTIWAKDVNNNAGAFVKATVIAKGRGANGVTACYELWAYVRTNTTDTAILSGPTKTITYESNAALDANFVLTSAAANAGVVALQVTGLSATNIDWEAAVSVISVTG